MYIYRERYVYVYNIYIYIYICISSIHTYTFTYIYRVGQEDDGLLPDHAAVAVAHVVDLVEDLIVYTNCIKCHKHVTYLNR